MAKFRRDADVQVAGALVPLGGNGPTADGFGPGNVRDRS